MWTLLIFKSDSLKGEYYRNLNLENYEKWITNMFTPNFSQSSVIEIDNAYHHSVLVNSPTTSLTKKANMINWLANHSILCSVFTLNLEVYELIKQNKPAHKILKCNFAKTCTFRFTVSTVAYHPHLSPIEIIWAIVK